MVRDLQIAQAWRDDGELARDRRPPAGNRCLWCDAVGHARKDCGDFTEALRANVVYLWNGRVHASETRRALELNIGRGSMKRLKRLATQRPSTTRHRRESGSRVMKSERRRNLDSGR